MHVKVIYIFFFSPPLVLKIDLCKYSELSACLLYLSSLLRSAVIAQSVWRLGYGLDDRGSRVRFPVGAGNSSLHHRVQNGSGAYPASYPMGTKDSFPECKAAGT
jgi:hypothetical protein